MAEDVVVMGVLGTEDPPIPDRDPGEDFGASSERAGDVCRCAPIGVDSVDGAVVAAGDVTADELDDATSFGWGDEATRSCWCAAAWCCCCCP